jgi:hypothetical protein
MRTGGRVVDGLGGGRTCVRVVGGRRGIVDGFLIDFVGSSDAGEVDKCRWFV